ncbi:MAG: DNA ligase [Candidatus Lokiarchaeota archaeon]|nr:DNA ligase [Candidatus Lokiarchaeota archaeon]
MKKWEPMLCHKGSQDLLTNDEYIFQPKLDGTRALFIEGKLINRRGRNIRQRYPEFDDLEIKEGCIVDGEVVVYNEKGLPDFHLLQSREQTSDSFKIDLLSNRYPATYVIFDCIRYQGNLIIKEPLETRMEYLKKAAKEGDHLQFIISTENGLELWNKIKELGLEGIMAKKKGSKYHPGKRSRACLKIKNLKIIDCIILGYTKGEGRRKETFGALLLGAYKDGELIQLGKVGTGWTDRELERLKEKMDNLIIEKEGDKVWIEQRLVCEVEYLEMTSNLELRAPSFQRLRPDKSPEECILE